jgi:hypothetical protein
MMDENGSSAIGILDEVELPIEVRLGAAELTLEQILRLGPGGVVSLGPVPDQPVELAVSGVPYATGELVIVDGSFAFRVGRVIDGDAEETGAAPDPVTGKGPETLPEPGEEAASTAAPATAAESEPPSAAGSTPEDDSESEPTPEAPPEEGSKTASGAGA